MAVEDAIQLGRRAIYHATHRDAYSGGVVNCKYNYCRELRKFSTNLHALFLVSALGDTEIRVIT